MDTEADEIKEFTRGQAQQAKTPALEAWKYMIEAELKIRARRQIQVDGAMEFEEFTEPTAKRPRRAGP